MIHSIIPLAAPQSRQRPIVRALAGLTTAGVLLLGAAAPALAADLDSDGLDDDWESSTGFSYPFDGDSDEDGLRDGAELTARTNAKLGDSDRDSLSDGLEVNTYHTDPLSADPDGDGIRDLDELAAGTDPHVSNAAPAPAPAPGNPAPGGAVDDPNGVRVDTDGDGLYDWDEANVYFTDPARSDTDGDAVSDGEEVYNGTNPNG